MKPTTIIAVVLAFACGLLVSALVAIYAPSWLPRHEEMVTVIVARKDLSQWTIIREPRECFEIREVEKKTAPAHVVPVEEFEKLAGRRLKAGLAQGEELTQEKLLDSSAVGIGHVKRGPRALAVAISGYVDMIHVVDGQSKPLVENVQLLAVDLAQDRGSREGRMGATATVKLDPEAVLKVTAAKDRGSIVLVTRPISLVLRPEGDPEEKKPDGGPAKPAEPKQPKKDAE